MNKNQQSDNHPGGKPDAPVIHIDKKEYRAPKNPMTGAELRALGGITSDYDLWKKVPGKDDILIGPGESVELKNGDHFYSAPSTLNPGRA